MSRTLTVTVPDGLAAELDQRVASGAYASRSTAVANGLRELFSREEALDSWLRNEVGPAYDELREDPARALSPEAVRAHIADLHAHATSEA
ncbi:ribbon-helix-helix domain-containing protein [Actinomyces ruminis]|uniref:Type II toxin-antitoxin system ParD family antitoxin n=1 Tax=Actinomyces ruminis TaxID=1937003 RepID=A0ABX4MCZ4_9ACTO|nr:CopG family transcriptional regulator [Actinomyces ruminis]PHP53365.1 type II toxin-antitoxin system ParD family antitoxin [Actinomyces ruminis]